MINQSRDNLILLMKIEKALFIFICAPLSLFLSLLFIFISNSLKFSNYFINY